jgi:hypothetical protein
MRRPLDGASRVVAKHNNEERSKSRRQYGLKHVENYWLGYSIPKKQFYFYYKLLVQFSRPAFR